MSPHLITLDLVYERVQTRWIRLVDCSRKGNPQIFSLDTYPLGFRGVLILLVAHSDLKADMEDNIEIDV